MRGKALTLVAVFFFSASIAASQTTGTILGVVRDSTGAVVPAALVNIRRPETGAHRRVTTDAQGRYHAPALPVGTYDVEASMQGFRTQVHHGVNLTVAQEIVLNFDLEIGQIAERVEVISEAPLVEATNATITGLVDQETIRELPLNGRSFDQLMQLQVGTVNARNNQGTTALGGGVKISISGVRPSGNSFLLDGTDINDSRNYTPGGASNLTLGVDTVKEFRVLTNSYSAEYGRSTGGVLTAVTKSGTNDLHGSLLEFFRNDNLDAADWEDTARGSGEKPSFVRNQFGGTLGGRIRKDETFYFGSYEGLRDRLGVSAITNVPTVRVKALGCMPPQGDRRLAEQCVGVAPGVRPWLDIFPNPNGADNLDGTGEFSFLSAQPTNQNYFTGRLDHSFSSSHSVFGRYTIDRSERVIPGEISFDRGPQNNWNQYLTVEYSSVLTATTLNAFRFGLNRSHALETNVTDLPSGQTFIPGQTFDEGGEMNIAGISGIGNYLNPRGINYTLFEWSDDLTLVRGSHTLKAGAIYKKILDLQEAATARGGRYDINGGLWSAIRGTSTTFTFEWPGRRGDRDWRQELFGAYLQEDFKWKPNFTWNLGVRLEFMTSPDEVAGRCANLTDVLQTEPKVGCPFIETFKNNWAPRVGFAWDTKNNSKFVVRGGWGVFFSQPFTTDWRAAGRFVPPFAFNASLGDGSTEGVPFPNAISTVDLTREPSVRAGIRSQRYGATPYVLQYNFNIQSQLFPQTGITLGYIGSQSRKLIISMHKNVRAWEYLPDGRKAYILTSPVLNSKWANVNIQSTEGGGNHNALVASLQQKVGAGFRVQGSYTFGKTFSHSDTIFGADFEGDATGGLTDGYNPGMDWGLATFSVRHNFILNYSYDLPFSTKNKLNTFVEGWQLSGIITRQSGVPFSVTTAFAPNDGLPGGGGGSPVYRPNILPNGSNNPIESISVGCTGVPVGSRLGNPDLYFDPCVFANETDRRLYGNLGRHTVSGPGLVNLDLSVIKNTRLAERFNLQFRSELFNILNHPNFNNPPGAIFTRTGAVTANRGRINTTNTTARQIQFGIKLLF